MKRQGGPQPGEQARPAVAQAIKDARIYDTPQAGFYKYLNAFLGFLADAHYAPGQGITVHPDIKYSNTMAMKIGAVAASAWLNSSRRLSVRTMPT